MKVKLKKNLIVIFHFLAIIGRAVYAEESNTSTAGDTLSSNIFTESTLEQYEVPEWFSEAKFGIWAHWGPQSVPRAGDWYARNMYIPGTSQYQHHLKNYGHPSQTGYKDIIPLWKAEKFNPDELMKLYKDAGAKYFVSMGVHHDNFDLWNSTYHKWNAVRMGPHRDIVGEWKKSATKYGLKFGVSEHLGASYSWFSPSHGYDQFWPMNGIGYDGENPAYADLYHSGKDTPYRDAKTWYTDNPDSQKEWSLRITDLIDQYKPDFLYSDGGIPFGVIGRSLVADFYNKNAKAHNGKVEAVYTHKDIGSGEFIEKAGVQDVERGVMEGIRQRPWQTDTSIGDWFYSENYNYKSTGQIVHMLTDIVSKNGNLLLNVVQYPEGDLPPESIRFLQEMAGWMKVNGEAIYATKPWRIYGEGPTVTSSGHFKEEDNYTAKDIRFTQKKDALYATTLAAPEKEIRIYSLGINSQYSESKIKKVSILGVKNKVIWSQNSDYLLVKLPEKLPTDFSTSVKIEFNQ